MCVTREGLELTRISVMNQYGTNVYDELVKPKNDITDYATQYSGITKQMLLNVTKTLDDVHRDLFFGTATTLPLMNVNTILIGHSIENDLKAMKLIHLKCIDTSVIYPHPRGPPYRSALRFLTKKWLGRSIQQGDTSSGGHDSAEDALGTYSKRRCEQM